MSFPLDVPLCYLLSLSVTTSSEGKNKGNQNLQYIITQNDYGMGTDLICLNFRTQGVDDDMNFISAYYNIHHNSIDITTFDGYILRINCNKVEEGLKTTAWTDHVLNALAIDMYEQFILFSLSYLQYFSSYPH